MRHTTYYDDNPAKGRLAKSAAKLGSPNPLTWGWTIGGTIGSYLVEQARIELAASGVQSRRSPI